MSSDRVPFLDLHAAYVELKDEIEKAVRRVLDSGWYILGPEVESFEAEWASYVRAEHCVGVASGLDALILALRALDIGPGDEVVVPANTYIATWLAVSATGATPVPVEPNMSTLNMDPNRVIDAISSATRALLPVHLYGRPADMEALNGIASEHDLVVIADAAQAHGASIGQTPVGGDCDITCWSFYPGKNLGAMGDGGAITTSDASLAERIALIRNYGSAEKYVNREKGVNSRLDPIQAAVLSVKLRVLETWNHRRTVRARRYDLELQNCGMVLPELVDGHVWHQYVAQVDDREAFQSDLKSRGVDTLVHYPIPPYLQEAYQELGLAGCDYPLSTRLAQRVVSLPIGPHMTDDQQSQVIDAIKGM